METRYETGNETQLGIRHGLRTKLLVYLRNYAHKYLLLPHNAQCFYMYM